MNQRLAVPDINPGVLSCGLQFLLAAVHLRMRREPVCCLLLYIVVQKEMKAMDQRPLRHSHNPLTSWMLIHSFFLKRSLTVSYVYYHQLIYRQRHGCVLCKKLSCLGRLVFKENVNLRLILTRIVFSHTCSYFLIHKINHCQTNRLKQDGANLNQYVLKQGDRDLLKAETHTFEIHGQ